MADPPSPTPDLSQLSDDQLRALLDHQQPQWQVGHVTPLSQYARNEDVSAPWYQEKYGPLSGMSGAQRFLAGTGRGMVEPVRQAGNIAGLVPDASLAESSRLDAPLLADPMGRLGNLAGETATLAGATAGGEYGAGLTGAGRALLAHRALTGALEGAGQGGLMAGPGNRTAGAVTGAVTGGGVPLATGAVNRAIQGAPRTPQAQLLLNAGVPLTPGQMQPGGTANLLEQSAESLPVIGPTVKSARENAEQEFGRAVIQRGAAPGVQINPSTNINQMYNEAHESWDPVYEQFHGYPVRPQIMTTGQNVPLSDALEAAARMPGLSGSRQRALNNWLQDRLGTLPQNAMTEDFIGRDGIRSAIRGYQRNLLNSKDVDAPLMSQALERAEQTVNATLASQLPAPVVSGLQQADRGYAQLKLIGNAVQRSGDQLSGLTPAKLSQAIRQGTDAGAYARGAGGDLRDLARAGTQVFETVAPPTGARVATGLGAAALGYASPHVALPVMGALGAGEFLSAATPLGRRLAAGQTAPQVGAQRLIGALQSGTPAASREAAMLAARTAINRDPRMQAIARQVPGYALTLLPARIPAQ